jgi:hypothetical protein
MDTFNQNNMPPMPGPMNNVGPEKKSHGPLIAVVVILLLIIIGGLYFLGQRMNGDYGAPAGADQITESLKAQNASDDLNSIEADLNTTNLDNLDQGAAAIEAELQ